MELLDYILDLNDNFWVINYIINGKTKGYIAYENSDSGRYNNITKKYYTKKLNNNLIDVPTKYKMIFKPRKFYRQNKNKLTGIWKDYVETLNHIGIQDKYLGIFGSYLIGFEIKRDVDFIIYDNLEIYKQNIEIINESIGATNLTKDYIEYQYNKFKNYYPTNSSLKKIISRNWSGFYKNQILSTPRFIDSKFTECNKIKIDEIKEITCEVIEDNSDYLPRRATVIFENQIYEIISPLWKYQSFARKGDMLKVLAKIDYENKKIILDEKWQYIIIMNEI